ncbi:hypothetical protein VNI00_010545 [Paramarasmius palmivorus]|uniref:Uncharacterized protein n=1 Tax=Paramarasmius palmivorus TaxID=297713 RepID=A0AAW0CKT5_9AGAR
MPFRLHQGKMHFKLSLILAVLTLASTVLASPIGARTNHEPFRTDGNEWGRRLTDDTDTNHEPYSATVRPYLMIRIKTHSQTLDSQTEVHEWQREASRRDSHIPDTPTVSSHLLPYARKELMVKILDLQADIHDWLRCEPDITQFRRDSHAPSTGNEVTDWERREAVRPRRSDHELFRRGTDPWDLEAADSWDPQRREASPMERANEGTDGFITVDRRNADLADGFQVSAVDDNNWRRKEADREA